MQIHIERERVKGYTFRCEKVSHKSNLCICSGALWLVANAIRYFVRSVEDCLEPSQTYDKVNKLVLLLLAVGNKKRRNLNFKRMKCHFN